jgi:hypothetical protein
MGKAMQRNITPRLAMSRNTHISTKSQDNTKTSRKHRTKEQVSSIQQPRICNSNLHNKKRRS